MATNASKRQRRAPDDLVAPRLLPGEGSPKLQNACESSRTQRPLGNACEGSPKQRPLENVCEGGPTQEPPASPNRKAGKAKAKGCPKRKAAQPNKQAGSDPGWQGWAASNGGRF